MVEVAMGSSVGITAEISNGAVIPESENALSPLPATPR